MCCDAKNNSDKNAMIYYITEVRESTVVHMRLMCFMAIVHYLTVVSNSLAQA